ncbi:MAG: DNA primase, partial [Planctomycetota bacterium]
MEGIEFFDALSLLGERCNIQVERIGRAEHRERAGSKQRLYNILDHAASIFENNIRGSAGEAARNYLNRRRMHPETFVKFRIGYSTSAWRDLKSKLMNEGFSEEELLTAGLVRRSENGSAYDLFRNRLMIPIFDIQNRVIGFGGRVLDDSLPKYINSPETPVFHKSQSFYGLNFARQFMSVARYAVIMEGYTDVIQAHSRQVQAAIATLGTALTADHARLLNRLVDRVILLFDGDEAGSAAAGRGVEMLLAEDLDVTVVTLEHGMDPFDYFSQHDAEDFAALVRARGQDFFDFTIQYFSMRYDINTPGGKTRLIRELMKRVSCHNDLIRKDLLLKKIAGTLGVSETLLRKEFMNLDHGGHIDHSGPSTQMQSGPGTSVTHNMALGNREVTITSSEDDLILGLVRRPELAGRFLDALQKIETDDDEASCILKAICELYERNRLDVRELISHLVDRPGARGRVISLVSDTRKTDPELLISSAIEVMMQKQHRREYDQVRKQGKGLLKEKSSAEADQLLLEITHRLKRQKAEKPKDKE